MDEIIQYISLVHNGEKYEIFFSEIKGDKESKDGGVTPPDEREIHIKKVLWADHNGVMLDVWPLILSLGDESLELELTLCQHI